MKLHLVRHGQTDWNATRRIQGQLDSELDDTGIQQAKDRGKDLDSVDWHAVYSSSSLRTRQTTELILDGKSYPVQYLDSLREVRLGIWQGQYWADIEKQFPVEVEAHAKALPSFNIEGAENSMEVQARGIKAIESIITSHALAPASADVLIVSHGAIMKTILAYYLNIPLLELYQYPSLPNCAHCVIEVDQLDRTVTMIASKPILDGTWV